MEIGRENSFFLVSGTKTSLQMSLPGIRRPKLHRNLQMRIYSEFSEKSFENKWKCFKSCRNSQKLRKVRRKLDSLKFDSDSNHSDQSDVENEEAECEFRPVVTADEAKPHMEWYNKLLELRRSHSGRKKHVFPPFPPPPLPSAMLKASRAQTVNPFEEVKRAAVSNLVSKQKKHVLKKTQCQTLFSQKINRKKVF